MNMDVNLHRLPDKVIYCPKFPVPLAAVRWHLQSTDSAAIPSKQWKDSLPSSETHTKEMQVFHIIKTKGSSIPKFSGINLSR